MTGRHAVLGVAAVCLAAGLSLATPALPAKPKPRPKCFGERSTIVGTARDDVLRGTAKADVISAQAGADRITGGGGNDVICGGPGEDVIGGGTGRGGIDGGSGFDTCREGERLLACEEKRPALPSAHVLVDRAARVVPPGDYVTEVFRPRVGFHLGSGWRAAEVPYDVYLVMRPEPNGLFLAFDRFSGDISVAKTVDLLTSVRGVDASAPVPVAIAGASGMRFDVTITSGESVVFFNTSNRNEPYVLQPTDSARVFVIDVLGKTVRIVIEAPSAEFASFAASAETVLAALDLPK